MKLHVFVRREFWVSALAPGCATLPLGCATLPGPGPLVLDSLPWPACLAPVLACLPKLAASQLAATTSLSAL